MLCVKVQISEASQQKKRPTNVCNQPFWKVSQGTRRSNKNCEPLHHVNIRNQKKRKKKRRSRKINLRLLLSIHHASCTIYNENDEWMNEWINKYIHTYFSIPPDPFTLQRKIPQRNKDYIDIKRELDVGTAGRD